MRSPRSSHAPCWGEVLGRASMTKGTFIKELKVLVERQGDETFIALALGELELEFVDEVEHQEFFLKRCAALWEESL